jgi:lipopolysaccharide export system protein LptC
MEHYPDDDTTQLTRPNFTAFDEARVATRIAAQSGLVSSNGKEVYFTRDVKVKKDASADKDWLTIDTDYLHITPDQDIARTDRAVTIKTPAAVITAIGMELNNRTHVVKLLSRVKGHYEKSKR